jgi:hypothetical protein
VVYVEPNKSRISGSAAGANTGVLFSASILLSCNINSDYKINNPWKIIVLRMSLRMSLI